MAAAVPMAAAASAPHEDDDVIGPPPVFTAADLALIHKVYSTLLPDRSLQAGLPLATFKEDVHRLLLQYHEDKIPHDLPDPTEWINVSRMVMRIHEIYQGLRSPSMATLKD